MSSGSVVKKAACHFCHNNCGLFVIDHEGKVIKVEGNKEPPDCRSYWPMPEAELCVIYRQLR